MTQETNHKGPTMHKHSKRLRLGAEVIKQLSHAEMGHAAGGVPTADVSYENAGCCSFDVACPTDGCATRSGSCRFC